jgi:hypothetical protein
MCVLAFGNWIAFCTVKMSQKVETLNLLLPSECMSYQPTSATKSPFKN